MNWNSEMLHTYEHFEKNFCPDTFWKVCFLFQIYIYRRPLYIFKIYIRSALCETRVIHGTSVTGTLALSRRFSREKSCVVRYRLSRYSQPANLKSERGNFLPGSSYFTSSPCLVFLCIGSRSGVLSPVRLVYPSVERASFCTVFLKVDKLGARDRGLVRREFPREIRASVNRMSHLTRKK